MSEKKDEKIKKWIKALKNLEEDSDAKVECPNCQSQNLRLIKAHSKDMKQVDKYLICENCKTTFSVTGSS